jgi:hypothetical protein
VTRADASHTARENLAALLHELGKNVGALVVDEIHFFDAKLADFFLAEKLALAAARSAGTAAGTTRAAFTARAAAAAETTAFATPATSSVAAMTTVTAAWAAGAAFTARRWSRGRCLRSRCWYWILFV